jgi:hypothetical protein
MIYRTCVSIAENSGKGMKRALYESMSASDYAELRLDSLNPKHVHPFLKSVG